jgi:hypothetical protein
MCQLCVKLHATLLFMGFSCVWFIHVFIFMGISYLCSMYMFTIISSMNHFSYRMYFSFLSFIHKVPQEVLYVYVLICIQFDFFLCGIA